MEKRVMAPMMQQPKQQASPSAPSPKTTVGIVFQGCAVDYIVRGSSADRHGGIEVGDEVLSVEGNKATSAGISSAMKGPVGKPVHLIVRKKSSGQLVEVSLERKPLWARRNENSISNNKGEDEDEDDDNSSSSSSSSSNTDEDKYAHLVNRSNQPNKMINGNRSSKSVVQVGRVVSSVVADEFQSMRVENTILSQEIGEKSRELQELALLLRASQKDNKELKERLKEVEEEAERNANLFLRCNMDLDRAKNERESLRELQRVMQHENEGLRRELEDATDMQQRLQNFIEKLTQETEQVAADKEELEEKLMTKKNMQIEHDNMVHRLQEQLQQFSRSLEKEKLEHSHTKDQLKQAQKKNVDDEQRIRTLKMELEALRTALDSTRNLEISNISKRAETAEESMLKLEAKLQAAVAEKEAHSAALAEIQASCNQTVLKCSKEEEGRKQAEEVAIASRDELTICHQQIQQLTAALEDLTRRNAELEDLAVETNEKLEEAERESTTVMMNAKQRLLDLVTQVEDSNTKVSVLTESLVHVEEQLQTAEARADEEASARMTLEKRMQHLEEAEEVAVTSKQQYEEAMRRLGDAELRASAAEHELETLKHAETRRQQLELQLNQLQAKTSQLEQHLEHHMVRAEKAETFCQELEEQEDTARKMAAQLSSKIAISAQNLTAEAALALRLFAEEHFKMARDLMQQMRTLRDLTTTGFDRTASEMREAVGQTLQQMEKLLEEQNESELNEQLQQEKSRAENCQLQCGRLLEKLASQTEELSKNAQLSEELMVTRVKMQMLQPSLEQAAEISTKLQSSEKTSAMLQGRMGVLSESIDQYETERKTLIEEVAKARTLRDEAKAELEKTLHELSKTQHRMLEAESNFEVEKCKVENLLSRSEDSETKAQTMRCQIEDLQAALEHTRRDLGQATIRADSAEVLLQELRRESEKYQKDQERVKHDATHAIKTVTEMETTAKLTSHQLIEERQLRAVSQQREIEAVKLRERVQAELDVCRSELANSHRRVKEAEAGNQQLQERLDELNAAREKDLNSYEAELKNASLAISQVTALNSELFTRVRQLEAKRQDSIEVACAEIRTVMQGRMEQLTEQMDGLALGLGTEGDVKVLGARVEELRKILAVERDARELAERDSATLATQLTTMQLQLETLKHDSGKQESMAEMLIAQMEEAHASRDAALSELVVVKENYRIAVRTMETLEKELDDQKMMLSVARNAESASRTECARMEEDLIRCREELIKEKQERSNAEERATTAQRAHQDAMAMYHSVSSVREEQSSRYEDAINSAERANREVASMAEKALNQARESAERASSAEERCTLLMERMKMMEKDLESAREAMLAASKDASTANERAEVSNRSLSETKQELKEALESLYRERQSSAEEIARLTTELESERVTRKAELAASEEARRRLQEVSRVLVSQKG